MTAPARTLRVALIGCGRMGRRHLAAISAVPYARVVAIADPAIDPDAAPTVSERRILICGDPDSLLAEARPDVVHIVTPPDTHAPLARRAIAAGCHVYVEKPFARTMNEAKEILDLAAAAGVSVCPGHQYLFERPALAACRLLGGIGSLVHAESYFSFRTVRRTMTCVEQLKDILPHAVYPLVEQFRTAAGQADGAIAVTAVDVDPHGEIRALVRLGRSAGIIVVTLNGRPIEQYQHLVGTNGCLRVDYVSGSITNLTGPGTGAGMLLTPYRRALQTVSGATSGFARRFAGRQASYPGLQTIVERFYASIVQGTGAPVTRASILETVGICERIGEALDDAERRAELAALANVSSAPAALPARTRAVLVTGGTGLLGRRLVEELRTSGYPVRVAARRSPPHATRVAGAEYVIADLARPIDVSIMRGISVVVHCAAETAGGRIDHERNSIAASRHVVEAAARAGARLIHISSLAVLKPGDGAALDERSHVDDGNLQRGPYVWGKAESEQLVRRLGAKLGVPIRVIRPGPLVDYANFEAPGRLGREIGRWYVAVGPRQAPMAVCDVSTAARVIRWFVDEFETAPAILNLVEAPAPRRVDLAERLRARRPDLRIRWVPASALRMFSVGLTWLQRISRRRTTPLDLYAAFSSERYETALAQRVISTAEGQPLPREHEHVA
jgi:predicted dehydrogenase/nucleoside-diphosphate-sugar epimerase